MSLPLPERQTYPLPDLAARWLVSLPDIHDWLTGGELIAAVWLPIMSVIEKRCPGVDHVGGSVLSHWEGYAGLTAAQSRRLLRNGRIALREFSSLDGKGVYQLPEAKDDIMVMVADVIVTEPERRRFEELYPGLRDSEGRAVSSAPSGVFPADPTFRSIVGREGKEHRFGTLQARVLRLLADSAEKGDPWQSGKSLLREAGSQSYSLSNLFKRHPAWRELIESDRRGYYRLRPTGQPGRPAASSHGG